MSSFDHEYETPARSRRWWPAAALVVLVAAGGFVLHSPWLSVAEIEIVGSTRSDPASRVAAAGVGEGAVLIWVDTDRVERAVSEDPWVAAVRVERVFPDRLVVEVAERTPVAWIEGLSTWMLVASDGTIVEVAAEPSGGYLRASMAFPDRSAGQHPIDPTWDEVVELATALRDDIGGTLVLETRGAELWTTAFGHDVRFGHPIDLADKGRTLRALLQEDLPAGAVIDVSSPLRPAIVAPADPNPGEDVEGSGEEG